MIDEVRPKLHVVIDTNVIVSGLLRLYSTSADILRLVVSPSEFLSGFFPAKKR
ncbi:MAG: hypothetical protein HPY52_07110 [Firmicutes bacterium]|nr:hypothetical protein [Bacillota bacterium]